MRDLYKWITWVLIGFTVCVGLSANAKHRQKFCRSKIYIKGPIKGPKGGCYCINPKNNKKKYIKRKYCERSK